ncbi:MAG TPA: ElyC/SanA/YdcF family protein [Bacteroidia bacterium]|nr:YdcF family protein [Bacteroidia bacterium]HRD37146.1 ElyC/SanA/YdcF family protein [Bacteroidia bacterium]
MRKVIYSIVFISVAAILSIFICNNIVSGSTDEFTYNDPALIPETKTGLLLGTSKYLKNGDENLYFQNRIAAAVDLFKSGKIKFIVVSGDNSKTTYDEPTDMKHALIEKGIDSTKIFLDYAGFRTYDSMVRFKEIFGQTEGIVVSQQFHNERAIYIGQKLGIKLYGYNAKDVSKYYGFKTMLREKFARVKVMVDFLIGTDPKFLGDKIEIK